jgi:hypothetical protein
MSVSISIYIVVAPAVFVFPVATIMPTGKGKHGQHQSGRY